MDNLNRHQSINPEKATKFQKLRALKAKKCTICNESFNARSHFALFCDECKEHSERYRFADWLSA